MFRYIVHALFVHTHSGFHIKPSKVNFCIQYYNFHNSDSPRLWAVQGTTLSCSLCTCKFLDVISKYVVKPSKNLNNCLYGCTEKNLHIWTFFICQVSEIFSFLHYLCISLPEKQEQQCCNPVWRWWHRL